MWNLGKIKAGGNRKIQRETSETKERREDIQSVRRRTKRLVQEGRSSQSITGHNFHPNVFIVHPQARSIQARFSSFQIGLAWDVLDFMVSVLLCARWHDAFIGWRTISRVRLGVHQTTSKVPSNSKYLIFNVTWIAAQRSKPYTISPSDFGAYKLTPQLTHSIPPPLGNGGRHQKAMWMRLKL